jgi:dihydroneopterin aldolase
MKGMQIKNDTIESVQDYDFLRERIKLLLNNRHFDLQETVCSEILDICLAEPRVVGAVVSTEKPDVYDDAESVGCCMSKFRDRRVQRQATTHV